MQVESIAYYKQKAKESLNQAYGPWVILVFLLSFSIKYRSFDVIYENYQKLGILMNFDHLVLPNLPSFQNGWVLVVILSFFLLNPIYVACSGALVLEEPDALNTCMKKVFDKENYGKVVRVMFIRDISVFVFTCLFFIPGVIKMYQYYYLPFVCFEHLDQSSEEILEQAKRISANRKLDFFVLDVSFLGWLIAGYLTFGIGNLLYVSPYYRLTQMHYYKDVKKNLYHAS